MMSEDNSQEAKRKILSKKRGFLMQDLLMVVLAIFLLVNTLTNMLILHGESSLEDRLVLSKYDFLRVPQEAVHEEDYHDEEDMLAEADANDSKELVEEKVEEEIAEADPNDSKELVQEKAEEEIAEHHKLQCSEYGGPSDEDAKEMVYWSDVPSDTKYVSPMKKRNGNRTLYMTFEPDGGGWNNIRMAMETVVGLAVAMGRTLVMPPQRRMYLLGKDRDKQRTHFGFADFFPFEDMVKENAALEMITMTEFLEREAMTGRLRDKVTGRVSFPPNNWTNWDGRKEYDRLREWLRTVSHVPQWQPGTCLATFAASGDAKDVEELKEMQREIHKQKIRSQHFEGNPVPVDAPALERLKENVRDRKELCVYNEEMQESLVVHFVCAHKLKLRLLVHFYGFLFLEDWKEDLWMKRFMRDHIRYTDEIQCAAGRIVTEMREIARKRDPTGNPLGEFDTFHVRRGDFQFKDVWVEADVIVKNSEEEIPANSTVFIATDEKNKQYFDPFRKRYDIHFLDDFKHVLDGVNTNYYGMIDQLVASKGRIFFGCWHSTFTGFIMRMRGYHSQKTKLPGYEMGELPTSYYYTPLKRKYEMHKYIPLSGAFFNREFPTSWRDLDKGIEAVAAND